MTPSDDADSGSAPTYVVCASCGSKAASSWSFCRSCSSSLDDAVPATEAVRTGDAPTRTSTGCPKCGHDEADVGEIATTGTGFSKLFDIQNNRFAAVSCTNCGYTEFYRQSDDEIVLDLFLG